MPSLPVDRIATFLINGGFRRLSSPITIAGVEFDLNAVLLGTGSMPDLVIVIDTAVEKEDRIRSKTEGIARALDVVRSKRPLTLILAGPRPRTSLLEGLSNVCRILPVGALSGKDDDDQLRNWLAVLMPLNLPQVGDAIANPLSELLESIEVDETTQALVNASAQGKESVANELHEMIGHPLEQVEADTQ